MSDPSNKRKSIPTKWTSRKRKPVPVPADETEKENRVVEEPKNPVVVESEVPSGRTKLPRRAKSTAISNIKSISQEPLKTTSTISNDNKTPQTKSSSRKRPPKVETQEQPRVTPNTSSKKNSSKVDLESSFMLDNVLASLSNPHGCSSPAMHGRRFFRPLSERFPQYVSQPSRSNLMEPVKFLAPRVPRDKVASSLPLQSSTPAPVRIRAVPTPEIVRGSDSNNVDSEQYFTCIFDGTDVNNILDPRQKSSQQLDIEDLFHHFHYLSSAFESIAITACESGPL